MINIVAAIFILSGIAFMMIAAIGIIRFPDFYIRMSVVTKASTIGLGLLLTGVGIYFNTLETIIKTISISLFIVLSSPISAHVIAKAASLVRVPFWNKTNLDDYIEAKETPDDPRYVEHNYGSSSKEKSKKI
ncbi:monovalent cation/H(+) antiporter subunit G [Porifericola rhodea]|uniref:monovalent cation/H(+) antiporter subunit G n=1 Tax=Porifericola rhodea TaxID=930972 RepID=UPI0026653FE9|nr:monovalent cation/H(+) antiporter subunit G [Porifericola rhodea]WKN31751.1 monovalent cation/H(+) antiporter subunit G [Porifericola rhodea]